MVRVTAVSNLRLALAFVNYMATQGITLTLRNSSNAAEIWLTDANHPEHVQHELQQFLVDPLSRRYQAASWQTGHTDARLHYQGLFLPSGTVQRGWAADIERDGLYIAVYILMQLLGDSTLMYWAIMATGSQSIPTAMARVQPRVPALLPAAYHL